MKIKTDAPTELSAWLRKIIIDLRLRGHITNILYLIIWLKDYMFAVNETRKTTAQIDRREADYPSSDQRYVGCRG